MPRILEYELAYDFVEFKVLSWAQEAEKCLETKNMHFIGHNASYSHICDEVVK